MTFREAYDWSSVVNPITDAEVKIAVEALRSGKYEQGRYCLKSEDGKYCCLGVINEALGLGFPDTHAKLAKESDDVECETHTLPTELQVRLYGMNDSARKPFAEIADCIEEGFGLKDDNV